MCNSLGLPISPHLLCRMPCRIAHYSGKASSLYMRQPRPSAGKALDNAHTKNKHHPRCCTMMHLMFIMPEPDGSGYRHLKRTENFYL